MITTIRVLLFGGLLGGAFGGAVAAKDAAPVEIVRLWTNYRDTQSFARLGELPKVDREPGGAIVLRTQPEARDGFYFTVRLRAKRAAGGAIPEGRIVLHVVAPDAAQPHTYTFPYSADGKRSALLLIGVTGSDWPHGETMPLAWKLEILDQAGTVVGGHESYLWRKP